MSQPLPPPRRERHEVLIEYIVALVRDGALSPADLVTGNVTALVGAVRADAARALAAVAVGVGPNASRIAGAAAERAVERGIGWLTDRLGGKR